MIDVMTKAQYNELLMRDAAKMLYKASHLVANAKADLANAHEKMGEVDDLMLGALQKFEQLRLDV